MKRINLTNEYIRGLTDAEGMFGLTVHKSGGPTGYKFSLEFKITQKRHSLNVLEEIQKHLGCGRISIDNRKSDTIKFVVTDISSLINIIIPFFLSNPLASSKQLNFIDFYKMSQIIQSKSHLTMEGSRELLDIYLNMNSKRTWIEKYNFLKSHNITITSGWLQGFIDGDGSFTTWVGLSSATRKTRHMVLQLFLEIKQNTHDVYLLQAIINFLGVGSIKPKFDINNPDEIQSKRDQLVLVIRETAKVVEFVDENPMLTNKRLDYADWRELYILRTNKSHLTISGLAKINNIRSNMNVKRVHSVAL